jgi:CubicO group peptidase (beta-lactamase class C family)
VARLTGGLDGDGDDAPGEDPEAARRQAEQSAALEAFLGPDSYLGKALTAPGGAFGVPGLFNTRAMRAAEVPAANMVADARSVARLYAAVLGDVVDDQGRTRERVLTPDQLTAATTQETEGPDAVLLDLDLQFGLGYMLHGGMILLGGPGSFGHFGMGGSVGWADPAAELAMGYVMNKMSMGTTGDTRSAKLAKACYESLA